MVTVMPSLVRPGPQRADSLLRANLSRGVDDVGFRQHLAWQKSNVPACPHDSADVANPAVVDGEQVMATESSRGESGPRSEELFTVDGLRYGVEVVVLADLHLDVLVRGLLQHKVASA